ncbi:MAG: protein arginine kinase [Oscillospiraceae bacterium]|nr:protein arginine kinase [Oscillospiraceae bacterium]
MTNENNANKNNENTGHANKDNKNTGHTKWFAAKGDQSDVVLSTRVRLARNLADAPFPSRLDAQGKQRVTQRVRDAVQNSELNYIDMARLPRLEAFSLAERRLISPEFAAGIPGSGLLLSGDEDVSVMLCEEDHIRIQVLRAGLALRPAYDAADQIDDALGRGLPYAFDENLGYLTQCPTNLGTAMRASVMLHLPGLSSLGRAARLSESIAKLGLTMRGAFGEGSEAEGALYQLSNQVTLGLEESAALENLQAITMQIAEQERRAAAECLRQPQLEDQIWRAWGILQNARRMESREAIHLLSLARMGAARGLLPLPAETLSHLMTLTQPATLSLTEAPPLDAEKRDAKRAELIRNHILSKV